MRLHKYLFGVVVVLVGLAIGWFVFAQTMQTEPNKRATDTVIAGSAELDGATFLSELGPLGKPADVQDTLVFANGTFVSTECDKRCGYPPAPYFVRRVDGKIEFVSESICLHKDATLVWHGTVDDGIIKGRLSWILNRWYWTIEKEFWFEGRLVESANPVATSH